MDIELIRAQFPSLATTDDGRPRLYFDNPAGTQVPRIVAERMADCLLHRSANIGGYFETSRLAGEVADDARSAMMDFLNAPSPDEIIFGQNMTSLTFHLARSIGRFLEPGDEVVVSRMDHDANVEPWKLMARDFDLKVRYLPFDTETFEFDLADLDALLNDRTRLVCVGGASNLTGTINDVKAICRRARDAGAWSFIDAVQSAPHIVSDVQEFGCDFFVSSAYKFFGPHQGILWGRRESLEQLQPYKLRPAPDELPWSFETGTQSHEGMAGTAAAVDYFAWVGETAAGCCGSRRDKVSSALEVLFDYERTLAERLVNGLLAIPGVRVLGITEPAAMHRRVPTVSFTHATVAPADIARQLAEHNIFAWSGHNYALEVARALDIEKSGGAVRIGPVHYNTIDEIDTVLDVLQTIVD
ncbi:MAG: cysteine desulfurase-like protein [Woeseiaceae bacterium]|nr:cysteine desulfurase-like protein [Woeseiaceae bacterium]NIP21473.1 cysteine desulfurase-like protein [Woeseiaceae bacterium]NIS90461.1 cysteine desulfurase-like protein [Woeseiaceae bacterium]